MSSVLRLSLKVCVLIVDIFPLKLIIIVQVTLLGMQGSSLFFDVLSVGSLAVVNGNYF